MADITGQAILHVLYEQLMKHDEVHRYEEWFTTALVQDDEGKIAGAVTRNIRDGSMELFAAKSVILATGGNGQVFDPTTNALVCTGDGIALAYRIGAPLMDMEMIQYHPTTLAGLGLLITEGARGEGAHLYNAEGERFMEKYAPNKMELASRDVVSRAEQTEIDEGRGFEDGTVALDITVVPKKRIHEALREILNVGRDFAGVDITKEPIHIKPGNHYVMGGVKTDTNGQTSIPGLYAAGECACVSVHGGNRLGANSLLDTLIFGRRSGAHAGKAAKGAPMPQPVARLARRRGRAHPRDLRPRALRPPGLGDQGRAGRDHGRQVLGVPRRGAPQGARSRSSCGCRRRPRPPPWTTAAPSSTRTCSGALELQFMIDNAETILVSAIERKESRGAQYRTDFPERNDDEWLKHITVQPNGDGETPEIEYSEVTMTQWEPEERTYYVADAQDFTLKVRRFDPESGEQAYWHDYGVELDPERSVLDGILQIRDREDASLAIRCSCRAGHLRLLRRAHQRQVRAGLQHAHLRRQGDRPQRRDHRRAHGQHARDQGPDRGHGRRPLEEDPAGGAVAAARGRSAGGRASTRWTPRP